MEINDTVCFRFWYWELFQSETLLYCRLLFWKQVVNLLAERTWGCPLPPDWCPHLTTLPMSLFHKVVLGILKHLASLLMEIFFGFCLYTNWNGKHCWLVKCFTIVFTRCMLNQLDRILKQGMEWGTYSWYSWMAAAISASDHVLSHSPLCDCHSLFQLIAFSCFGVRWWGRGFFPHQPILNQKQQNKMKISKTENVDIELLSTTHKWTDILMVGADIWFLNALDMVGIETFSTLNPQIIINVSVNAILYQKLVFQMHGWLSQIMANETAPIEVLRLLGLLPSRNLGHTECK